MYPVRILHVDDEPDIREVVEISLGLDPCFAVRSCASGGDALVEAAEWAPHMILCDVMMPEVDGYEASRQIREFEQLASLVRTPIIAITCVEDSQSCLAAGMDDYHRKPILPEHMQLLVAKWSPNRTGTCYAATDERFANEPTVSR